MGPPDALRQFIDALGPAFEAGDPDCGRKSAEAAHVRLVQASYRAAAAGDLPGFLAGLADDAELETVGPATIPYVGRWRGRDEVAGAVARNFGYLEDQRPEVLAVVAQGDTVIVVARERGRCRPSGRPYDMHWVQQFTFAGGKLLRFRQVFDSAALLPAPGAADDPR